MQLKGKGWVEMRLALSKKKHYLCLILKLRDESFNCCYYFLLVKRITDRTAWLSVQKVQCPTGRSFVKKFLVSMSGFLSANENRPWPSRLVETIRHSDDGQ